MIISACVKVVKPPKKLTVSEWADEYRQLSSEASAESGRWRTSRAEYQRGIMDAFSDPSIDTVVWMSSAQVGKTEALLNIIGYFDDKKEKVLDKIKKLKNSVLIDSKIFNNYRDFLFKIKNKNRLIPYIIKNEDDN